MIAKIGRKVADSYPRMRSAPGDCPERVIRRTHFAHPDLRGLPLQLRGIRKSQKSEGMRCGLTAFDTRGHLCNLRIELTPIAGLHPSLEPGARQKPDVGVEGSRGFEIGRRGLE